MSNYEDTLPDGFTLKNGSIVVDGEFYENPDFELTAIPDEIVDAMESAHTSARSMYGDEGNGYEPRLMIAYLLSNPDFKDWVKSTL